MLNPETTALRQEEDEIIRQTLDGQPDAFAHLILKYKDPLFDLACRILGNRTEAEDVLEDAFLDAYKHLAAFDHQSKFSTWMYSIVLNRVRNHLRRKKVIRWVSLSASRDDDEDSRPPEFADPAPTTHRIVEQKLELEMVQKELQRLPELYQTIFIMHYFQNLALAEVAERLDRPVGTVKVYLHRARKMLYKRIARRSPPSWRDDPMFQTVAASPPSLAR